MDIPGLDLWKIPAGVPPPGVVPNLIDPPTQGPLLSNGIYVLLPLTAVFYAARVYTRISIHRAFGVDDIFCTVAFIATLAYAGVLLGLLNLRPITPLGRHLWDIPVGAYSNEYLELIIMALFTYPAAAMLVKLTILTLYYRIFQPVLWVHYTIWTGIAGIIIFYVVSIVVLLANCVPSGSDTWFSKVSVGTCPVVQVKVAQAQGIFGLVSDIFVLAIPVWLVSRLTLDPKRKASVMIVFLTGLLAIASSAGGLATRELVSLEDPNFLTSPYLFSMCECCIGLICSCMPVITVLLKSLTSKTLASWDSAKKYFRSNSSRSSEDSLQKDKSDRLPEIPRGTLTGLRTVMRRFQRTQLRSSPMTDLSTFNTLNSDTDQDYHEQLRDIHGTDYKHGADRTKEMV